MLYLIMMWPNISHVVQVFSLWEIPINHMSLQFIGSFATSEELLIKESFILLHPCCYLVLMLMKIGPDVPTINMRSTTGCCMFLGTSLIPWKCKKQIEFPVEFEYVEYRSLSSTSSEVICLCRLLRELGIFLIEPTSLLTIQVPYILLPIWFSWAK